jgi:hypothetical protein
MMPAETYELEVATPNRVTGSVAPRYQHLSVLPMKSRFWGVLAGEKDCIDVVDSSYIAQTICYLKTYFCIDCS